MLAFAPAARYKDGGVTLFEGQEPDVRVEITAAQRRITTRGLHLKKGGGVRPLTPSDLDKFDVILGIVSLSRVGAGVKGRVDEIGGGDRR